MNKKIRKSLLISFSPLLVFFLLIFLESGPFSKYLIFVIDFYVDHQLLSWILLILLAAIIISIKPLKRYIIKLKADSKANSIILVKQNSRKYQQLLSINARYAFCEIPKAMEFHRRLESNKDYDRYDIEAFFYESISENYQEILEYQKKANENSQLYALYCDEISHINNNTTVEDALKVKMPVDRFHEIENSLLKYDELQQPVCNCTIECHISYLSPQGRNHRSTFKTYDDECITKAVEKYEINRAHYTSPVALSKYGPQYERSLMSDDLRYRVLKRDGFRCQICGHGQADGVKLHVDHILPVTKGGRTIMSNLRTLCSSCNLGKSDKYDESGPN